MLVDTEKHLCKTEILIGDQTNRVGFMSMSFIKFYACILFAQFCPKVIALKGLK
jgi:hypothetical protein